MPINLVRVKNNELGQRMRDLKTDGYLVSDKYRLLDLVDYQNDAQGGWDAICEAFEEVGGDPALLKRVNLSGNRALLYVGSGRRLRPRVAQQQ